ncbi:unnamed protein product [Clavelina lepadiformis]|uniref:Uncharacterized protein n=1 Tax=Clavelina lepadiformis TaxID=159417 RepID=A0ABP0F531_CLALP
MPSVKEVIDLISYLAYRHSIIIVAGENSRKCIYQEKPLKKTVAAFGRTMMCTTAIGTSNVLFLSEILYRFTDENKKKLVESTKRILQNYCEIDWAMVAARKNINRPLRHELLNNLKYFIEFEADSLFLSNNSNESESD